MQGKESVRRPEPLFRKLAPRQNASAKAVAAHQRARLHAAMIEACARHGYAETTARELAALAGVSTKALYNHFESKEACFLATYDLVVQQAIGRISAAYRGEARGGKPDRARGIGRAFDAFAAELVQRPAPSRLALIEIFGAADANTRIERAETAFATMISTSFAQAPDGAVIDPRVIRGLIGGVWFVARTRLLDADPRVVAAAAAELGKWLLAYRSPAGSQLPTAQPRRPVPPPDARRVDVASSERARMLQAAATMAGRGGFAALSPGRVAEAAGVAVTAFDAEFEDTRACFLSMLEWLSAHALAEALRESEDAPSWGSGVSRAVGVLFRRLATDPALARAAFLDSFAVGPAGAERRAAIMRGFADLLARRAPAERRPSPLVAEAIVGSVWSIARRYVASGRRELLPASSTRAAFVALAPIIGAEAAVATICVEHDSHARPTRGDIDRSVGALGAQRS
jgi:AcrR family transcriptional regulator